MVYLLKAFGHTPLLARDGLEGIEAAGREHPDLILCDIQLPHADGVEVCRQLKQNPELRDIPMIALTAYAMVGDREKLLAEGFNGYMSKPINPQTFIADMSPYLKGTKLDPRVSGTAANPAGRGERGDRPGSRQFARKYQIIARHPRIVRLPDHSGERS